MLVTLSAVETPDVSPLCWYVVALCSSEAFLHLKTANSTNRFESVLQAEELRWTFPEMMWIKIGKNTGPLTHTHTLMLSGASPLFDNKQVFIGWIHVYVRFSAGKPRFSASLLFSFVLTRRCRCLPEPSGALWSALFFWEVLWFFTPLFILSSASTSGKILCFIQYDLTACLPGGGHRPLWFPWFHAAGAFPGFVFFCLEWWTLGLTVVIEKDVFVFVMADFLLLLRWFLSWQILRSGGEMAVHLQIWEKDKQNWL